MRRARRREVRSAPPALGLAPSRVAAGAGAPGRRSPPRRSGWQRRTARAVDPCGDGGPPRRGPRSRPHSHQPGRRRAPTPAACGTAVGAAEHSSRRDPPEPRPSLRARRRRLWTFPRGGGWCRVGPGGQRVDDGLRSDMERRLGALRQLRVHTDVSAIERAEARGARAFAQDGAVHFAAGAFNPQTAVGHELLTHELTHAIQQAGDSRASPATSVGELEAEAAANARAGGGAVRGRAPGGVTLLFPDPRQPRVHHFDAAGDVRRHSGRSHPRCAGTHHRPARGPAAADLPRGGRRPDPARAGPAPAGRPHRELADHQVTHHPGQPRQLSARRRSPHRGRGPPRPEHVRGRCSPGFRRPRPGPADKHAEDAMRALPGFITDTYLGSSGIAAVVKQFARIRGERPAAEGAERAAGQRQTRGRATGSRRAPAARPRTSSTASTWRSRPRTPTDERTTRTHSTRSKGWRPMRRSSSRCGSRSSTTSSSSSSSRSSPTRGCPGTSTAGRQLARRVRPVGHAVRATDRHPLPEPGGTDGGFDGGDRTVAPAPRLTQLRQRPRRDPTAHDPGRPCHRHR